MRESNRTQEGPRDAGFTLVEALVAMVVLIFGLMAVTNLLLVAASSNAVANQGTAAAASASQVMEMLKATPFKIMADHPGGTTFSTSDGAGKSCSDKDLAYDDWHCSETLPGVGVVHTHWWITGSSDARLMYIRVRSEGLGALTGRRSRSEFTTFRSCTNAEDLVSTCPPVPNNANQY